MPIVDAHVHVYPHHDAAALLTAFRHQAAAAGGPRDGDALILALVERSGADVFGAWRDGRRLPVGARATPIDTTALRIGFADGAAVYVLAGCQIACRERVEILGLGCRLAVPDGLACEAAVARIADAGGVPVLAWGVGKWWFQRAAVVRRLLARFAPDALLLGDTALRPLGWPEPPAMRRARRTGRRVLAGSDPLPPAGEERMAGRYVTLLDCAPLPEQAFSAALRAALRDPATPIRHAGRRSGPLEFLRRMTGQPGKR